MQNSRPIDRKDAKNSVSTMWQPKNRIDGWLQTGLLVVLSVILLSCIAATSANAQTYTVTIDPAIQYGSVAADTTYDLQSGDPVTLTITPNSGYEFISLNVLDDASNIVLNYNGTGSTTSFNMPSDNVTVFASFQNTDDKNDVLTAKSLIENGTFTVAQEDADPNSDEFLAWLVGEINGIAGMSATGVEVHPLNIVVPAADFTQATPDGYQSPGAPGSFKFTVQLQKGHSLIYTTTPVAGTITPAAYNTAHDNADITAAKDMVEAETYSVNQSSVTNFGYSDAQAAVATILSGLNWNGVAHSVTDVGYQAPVAGTVPDLDGEDGWYTFTVTLSKNGGTPQTTTTLTLNILAEPYDNSHDNADISAAVNVIQNASPFTDTQANVTNLSQAVQAVFTAINGLSLPNGVTYSVAYTTSNAFEPATQGTAGNPSGSIGTFDFTVYVNKGAGLEQETTPLQLTITATPYNSAADDADITAALGLVNAAFSSYSETQANIANQPQARAKVESIINGLSLNGVKATVNDLGFTAATAGSLGNTVGLAGSYAFSVSLTKGGGTPRLAGPLSMTITATPYDNTQDSLDIAAAKALIEGATYTATQANAAVSGGTTSAISAVIYTLPLNNVGVVSINIINSTPAVAGTASTPAGTNGVSTFTVELNKGAATNKITAQLTLTVKATPYIPAGANLVNIDLMIDGTITASSYTPEPGDVVTLTVTPALGFRLNGISVDEDGGSFANVTSTNNGNGIHTFTMPAFDVIVTASFAPTNDQQAVWNAQGFIDNGPDSYTVAQATANSEADVKTWLAGQINGLSGVSGTGINVSASNITISGFAPAVAGTASSPGGTNSNFTFVVSLQEANTKPQTSKVINCTITATSYNPAQDNTNIGTAITDIQGLTYPPILQANAGTATDAKAVIEAYLNSQNLGVQTTVITSAFIPAQIGTPGIPSGTNGKYIFTVQVNKGAGTMQETVEITVAITATPYMNNVTVNITGRGTVTAMPTQAASGGNVTLTIAPATGYYLDSIGAHETNIPTNVIALSGTGNTRTAAMPANGLTVDAIFKGTADQIAVETAISIIEYMGSVTVEQATANTEDDVKEWLAGAINYNSRMYATGIRVSASDITLSNFSAAQEGTASKVRGTNGSFKYTVTLQKGVSATITTVIANGTITASAYVPTYTITIPATAHGTVTANVSSAKEGETVTLTITPAAGYELDTISTTPSVETLHATSLPNVYEFTMPASNVTVNASFTESSGNESLQASALKAYVQNGTLHVSGLTAGKTWSVYSISGALLYQSKASGGEAEVSLSARGVYLVTSEIQTIKVVY